MVAIPTTKDEDAKRPNRERQSLVGEQTRILSNAAPPISGGLLLYLVRVGVLLVAVVFLKMDTT